jgi:hypothetical protein
VSKFNPIGEKAQAAAPFELFVAVIIMTFVVIVGYNALVAVTEKVCLNTVDREMTKFKVSLEGTVKMKSQNKIFFSPDSKCFTSKSTIMKIEIEPDKRVCAARCNYPSDGCFVMTFSNPTIADGFISKCLELPPFTNFVTSGCTDDLDVASQGYSAIDPMTSGKIGIGSYIFKNISPAGDTYPKICILYK